MLFISPLNMLDLNHNEKIYFRDLSKTQFLGMPSFE